jgi:hypothetical protein
MASEPLAVVPATRPMYWSVHAGSVDRAGIRSDLPRRSSAAPPRSGTDLMLGVNVQCVKPVSI